jgi:hypothetical protein
MQFNVLLLYFNGVIKKSYFLNYQHLHMSWIIHFELIKTIIQMLYIALNYINWNTHKNLVLTFILEWLNENFHICWIINIYTWIESFTWNVLNSLPTSYILHSSQFFEWMYKNLVSFTFTFKYVNDYVKMFTHIRMHVNL